MSDMLAVITPRSDQISADDLIAGPMTVTITGVSISPGQEQPVSMSLHGMDRVYRPCKSMSRVLVQAWGADAKAYAGRSLTLYRDPKVRWGGMEVGGIRISHMSHIDRDLVMMLTESKANRKPHKVRVLADAPKPEARTMELRPDDIDPAAVVAEATAQAMLGKEKFGAWWKANPDKRDAVKPHLEKLQAICAQADAKSAPPAAEPELDEFGLPPLPEDTRG